MAGSSLIAPIPDRDRAPGAAAAAHGRGTALVQVPAEAPSALRSPRSGHAFDAPEQLTPEAALAEAQGYFADWSDRAEKAAKGARFYIAEGDLKDAAFLLHQTVERLYHCFLLVQTLYSPKSHRLNFLRSQAEQLAPSLASVWPRQSKFEQRCFELLRRAYIDARYSPHFKITAAELDWLAERIAGFQDVVRELCAARLEALRARA